MTKLTQAEIDSLKCCPASDNFKPAPGNRTAYVKTQVRSWGLVRPLWVHDRENDEVFFTWQRTPAGDDIIRRHDERNLINEVKA